jgi:serine/threonine protein kinase
MPIDSESVNLPWDDLILKPEDITFDIVPESQERVLLGAGRFGKVYSAKLFGSERVAVKCIQPCDLHSTLQHSSSSSSSQIDGRDLIPRASDQSSHGVTDSALATRSSQSVIPNSSASNPSKQSQSVSKSVGPSKQVLREIALLKACRSQHIVSFMGACFLDGEVQLVTELMPAGDLWNALRKGQVSWSRCGRQIAMDVASGLSYLHSRRVIHLDLKSSNILLRWCGGPDESKGTSSSQGTLESEVSSCKYQAKVSDVGLARIVPESREYISSLGGAGTWNWCAPEVILSQKCTSAADMWSFGVILWELCTQEIPVRGRMRRVRYVSLLPTRPLKRMFLLSWFNLTACPVKITWLSICPAGSQKSVHRKYPT